MVADLGSFELPLGVLVGVQFLDGDFLELGKLLWGELRVLHFKADDHVGHADQVRVSRQDR